MHAFHSHASAPAEPSTDDATAWLALSAFEGEPEAALLELHRFLARRYPGVTLALGLVRNLPEGQARLAGLVGADGRELLPASDPFGERVRLPLFDDALAARTFATLAPKVVTPDAEERLLPFAQALSAPGALLALPVFNQGKVDHWIVLGHPEPRRYAAVDPAAAMRDAALAYALLSQSIAVRTLTAEATRTHRQIEDLADVQRLLQPDGTPIRGLAYAIHWQPAETAAGDYYDVMNLSGAIADYVDTGADAWGCVIADVSGHGAAAAMEAVQFDAILRTYDGGEAPGGPAGAINYANRHFFSRRQRRHFMTALLVACRPDHGTVTYVCAGHLPAVLRRGDRLELLGRGTDAGIPLGILREHRWENCERTLELGDLLVLYTDGVVEARDARGEMFGEERLHHAVLAGGTDVHDTLGRVVYALEQHQGGAVGADDQTLIVLARVAPGRTAPP